MDAKMPFLGRVSIQVSTRCISKNKWINLKITYVYEINKIFVRTIHKCEQIFVSWHSYFTSRVWCYDRIVVLIEKDFSSARSGKDWSWRDALDFHHKGHMIFFVFAGEEWVSDIKFVQNAAKAPHVDCCLIGNSQYNFWCSIKPWLDIGINFLIFKTTWSKINNFDSRLVDFSQQNILWFQITVHNIIFIQKVEGYQNLYGKPFDQVEWKALEMIHLNELI